MITLSEDWMLDFAPHLGGSMTLCQYQGRDILRPAVSFEDPRMTSAFPMVPFIGRITNGCFAFDGHHYRLNPNMPPEPHAIHGNGWQSPWTLNDKNGEAVLEQSYDGSADWPWVYVARQVFTAAGNTLHTTLTLENKSTSPMPAGLGWHPYFPKAGASLRANVQAVWQSPDDDVIGDRACQPDKDTDLRQLRPVNQLNLDHCYSMTDEIVHIEWPERGIDLSMVSSPQLSHLTVYTPLKEDYFCVEPVSHIPDAVNSELMPEETGLCVLQPGETFETHIAMSIALSPT